MAESGLTLPLTPLKYCDFVVKDEDRKLLTWENFNCWIKCFCIVTFDLELGQVIEVNGAFFLSEFSCVRVASLL